MPNPVAYNATTPPSGGFQRATITYGLSGSNYGANSPGGLTYYNSLPTSSAWVIVSDSYTLGLSTQGNAKPVMWSTGSASTGSLIRLINGLPSMTSSFTDYYSAVNWLQSTNKYFLLNNGYENIVTDGLVLNLDAGWWNSYPTTGTTWTDLSGNNLNGTLTNGPTFNSANSGFIVCDGIDDFVNFTTSPSNVVTVSVWINLNNNGNFPIILAGNSDAYDSGQWNWSLFSFNGNFFIRGNGGSTGQINTPSSTLVNVWTNWVLVRNDGTGTCRAYKNGTLFGTSDEIGSVNSSLYIGKGGQYYNGKISTTQIYNRALSAAEVLQNYNAQKGRFGL